VSNTTNNIPDIRVLEMLPEGNRQEALDWMAQQPPADIDDCINRLNRWEVRIGLCGIANTYYIYDRSTKQSQMLNPDLG
jgi:hypothetical protein